MISFFKVKARRSCAARRDREEIALRQQEALLAQFKKLKAKQEKKKVEEANSDSDSDEDQDMATTDNVKKTKKKHMISSSSESETVEDSETKKEEKKKQPSKAKSNKAAIKKKAISDSSSSEEENEESSDNETTSKAKVSSKKANKTVGQTRNLLDTSDEEEDKAVAKAVKASKEENKPRKVPVKSATAKIKTEISSSDEDSDDDSVANKVAATAVLLQKKKPVPTSKAIKDRQETLESSSSDDSDDESVASPSPANKPAKTVTKRKSSSEESGASNSSGNKVAEKAKKANAAISGKMASKEKVKEKNEREKLELDKKMSKIFGSSSEEEDEEENNKKPRNETSKNMPKMVESDEEVTFKSAAVKSDTNEADVSKKAKKIKKERQSSGRSSTGSRRETAESLFDQLTVSTDEKPSIKTELASPKIEDQKADKLASEGYSVFAEGAPKEAISSPAIIKTEDNDAASKELEQQQPIELSELDKSIASITEDVKEKTAIKSEESEMTNLVQEAATSASTASTSKRSVISQEETDQAVTALLGESFENSFEEKPMVPEDNNAQMETDASQPVMEDDEAAKAVAGLASEMRSEPEDTPFEEQPREQPQDLHTVLSEQIMVDPPKTEEDATSTVVLQPEVKPTTTTPTTTRGRSRGRGRGGRGAKVTETVEQPTPAVPATTTPRGTTRGRGGRSFTTRSAMLQQQQQQQQSGTDVSESSDVEMKSPADENISTAITTRGGRGSRGRGRGGRGNNNNSQRRSSETSTDSISNKTLITASAPAAATQQPPTGTSGLATSVFDFVDDDSEMMASPTLKEEKAKKMQLQQQLNVEINNEPKKEVVESAAVKSPNTQQQVRSL